MEHNNSCPVLPSLLPILMGKVSYMNISKIYMDGGVAALAVVSVVTVSLCLSDNFKSWSACY